jgi:uncharacterized protein (DUF1800 family)
VAHPALEPYLPAAGQWTRAGAAHLLARAGFGPAAEEIDRAVADGPEKTVDRLLTFVEPSARFAEVLRAAEVLASAGEAGAARAAWMMRMIHADNPLQEKLTLFWHGHFATGNAKVADLGLMTAQIEAFRRGCVGKFRDLLRTATRDPAMIIWLDNNTNRKGRSNENYAREIMELFSLGVGNYTEADIKEAGRAFTGWHTDRRKFTFNPELFDAGAKTVFGRTGNFGGDDVVDLCAEHPACARFIAGKLFRFFVHDKPDEGLLAALADEFRRTGLDTGRLMRTLLLSRELHSERARRALIKSPVEFVVGSIRSLGARFGATAAARTAAEMGQSLLDPPTVKGWDGGRLWINSATVLVRLHFVQALCLPGKTGEGVPAAEIIAGRGLKTVDRAADFLLDLLLRGRAPAGVRERLIDHAGGAQAAADPDKFRALAQMVMSLPEYQLN